MTVTFGTRLKKLRKSADLTQQELAEEIGVSVQAISKWETDTGMPDISQIVPLSRVLDVSADVLLGIVDENDSAEFDAIYKKCMAIETVNSCSWPPAAEKAEVGFQMMYEFFLSHPNNVRAAKYLLDLSELYWGKFHVFADDDGALKECERFANCIFRHSDDADLQAEARFLIASVWARVGQKEKAEEMLSKMPFRYGDRCYWSAEVAEKVGDYEKAEALCRESFSYRVRFISRTLRLMAHLPSKSYEEQTAYEEYMLRIINAFLSGGNDMPHRQVYQKMSILVGLVKRYLHLGDAERAAERFEALVATAEDYLAFINNGVKGSALMLFDDGLDYYDGDVNGAVRRETVMECLHRAIGYGENMELAKGNGRMGRCVAKAKKISGETI